ncbi:MAG TPA: hypothetical protein VI316_08995 [Candidatus Dormibacteraeota bacterium]
MLTYVLILLVVIAVLYGSFRALSGGAPVAAEDYRTVLSRICEFTSTRAAELDAALEAAQAAPARDTEAARGSPGDALVEAAAAGRKQLGGYHQQLARLETDAAGPELEQLQTARDLLTAAVEDLAWACRLIEGGSYADNPGISGAVAQLREHAQACLGATAPALR